MLIRREGRPRRCPIPVTRDWEGEDQRHKVGVDEKQSRRGSSNGGIPSRTGPLMRIALEIESIQLRTALF